METVSEGLNHRAIHIGSLDELGSLNFKHPRLGINVSGKGFVGELLGSTGAELSFTELQPRTTISFLHKHRKHEEIYIFLKGEGKYQVDGEVFPVREGSVVRVAPEGSRTLRNDGDTVLVYLVIQATSGSLTGYDVSDGYREKGEILL